MKKIMSIVLVFVLVISIIPIASVDAISAGVGSKVIEGGMRDFKWPVPSSFGLSSCFKDGRNHDAIDIAGAARGADVVASYDGTVYETGYANGYGNYVLIEHDYKLQSGGRMKLYSKYNHLNSISVSKGQNVYRGKTVVGGVGDSGGDYPVHLDYQILTSPNWGNYNYHNVSIDPYINDLLELPSGVYCASTASCCGVGPTACCCYLYLQVVKAQYAIPICEHSYKGEGVCSKCGYVFPWQDTKDTSYAGTYTVTLSGGTYPRPSAPYSDSAKSSTIFPKGAKISVSYGVTNAYNNIWYYATYGGVSGFVNEDNVQLESRPTQQFTCLISSPAEGAVVPKSAYPVIGTLTSAYYQIKEVKAYIDGSCYATVSNVNATSLELRPTAVNQKLDFASLSRGRHVLRIDARDSQSSSFVTVINRTFYTETTETHTHQYSYRTTTEPTCTTDGVKTYTCSCGDSYTEVVPAYGHNWCAWEVKQSPTCTSPGYRERLCQWCYGRETEDLPVVEHTYGSVRYEATHPHRAYKECSRCGYVNYTGAYGTQDGCTACLGMSNIGEDFYALIIADKSSIYLEADSDRNVELTGANDADDPKQIWHFLRQSDGTYKIINEYTGLVLDASDFGTENGTNVGVWENNDLSAQRWKISGGNPYIIAASYSDKLVLDVAGGNQEAGTNIQLYEANGTDAQMFKIYRIEWNGVNYQKPAAPDPAKIIDISSSNGITTVTWSESADRGRYDDRVYDLRIWEGNVPDGSTGAYFTAYCIDDTSYKVELPNGTYTFMVTAVNQMYYEHYTKGEFVLCTINSKFDVDLNAYIDGQVVGNTKGYGTADVYINGELVADDVTDYCSQWPVGTTYEFKDIKPNPGYSYNGVYEGQRVGTVGNERAWIAFDFSRIDNSIIKEQGEEHYYNGQKYLYYNTPLTWYAANEYCKSIGGHLVTINDSGEDNFVRSLFDSGKRVWIGATDQNSEGNWAWVTGEAFSYASWSNTEPNNDCSSSNDGEDFAHYTADGRWNDVNGDETYAFICEFSGCDHFYMMEVVKPTCTSSGYTLNTCINCGDSYKDDYKAALGHDNSYKVTSKPTTSEAGKLTGTCSRCRETDVVTLPKLNSTDYTYEVTKVATCAATGTGCYTWKDTTYGKFYFDVAIAKTAHSYSATTIAPTCTEQGYTVHTCSCEESYKDNYTAAMGHSYSNGSCVNCGEADPDVESFHNPFEDVNEKDYFYTPVLWAVQKGITNGTSATKFSPDAPCTRGQIVTFLWRACGSPEPSMVVNPFTDVSKSAYYYKAVLWALENGITTGTGKGKFSPEDTCTRGQVATFLWRAQGKPAPTSTSNPFSDVNSGAYYYDAILWAVEKGITNGTGKGKFSPDDSCTRGQIVTFLYRALN